MQFDDNQITTNEGFEKMAKAYAANLKEKGFIFIKFDEENFNFLLDEVFEIYFKLESLYKYLNGFLGSANFLDLCKTQIKSLRELFSYTKNRAFQIRGNKTKCLLCSISLENQLILKLFELAKKSEKLDEISAIINQRLVLCYNNYKIEGLFQTPLNI